MSRIRIFCVCRGEPNSLRPDLLHRNLVIVRDYTHDAYPVCISGLEIIPIFSYRPFVVVAFSNIKELPSDIDFITRKGYLEWALRPMSGVGSGEGVSLNLQQESNKSVSRAANPEDMGGSPPSVKVSSSSSPNPDSHGPFPNYHNLRQSLECIP